MVCFRSDNLETKEEIWRKANRSLKAKNKRLQKKIDEACVNFSNYLGKCESEFDTAKQLLLIAQKTLEDADYILKVYNRRHGVPMGDKKGRKLIIDGIEDFLDRNKETK